MRRFAPALAILLLFGTRAQAGEDIRLSLASIVSSGSDRAIDPGALAQGPGAVLAAVAGTETLPVGCATPLLGALARPAESLPASLRQASLSLFSRPALLAERVAETRDGRFAVHYSEAARVFGVRPLDRDGNGLPDPVDRISEALGAARSFLVGRLGYPAPSAEDRALDVFLVELDHGLEGYVVPSEAQGAALSQDAFPFLVIDANLPADRVMPAVLHQVAHASLMAFGSKAAPWWSEASAGFLTYTATGDLKGAEAGLRARLQSQGRALASDDLLLMQGSLLWPLFLSERSGNPGVVRQIWGEIASHGADPLAATDLIMRRSAGLPLAELHREFAVWNLFTGSRDDGRHYSVARSLPEESLPTVGPALPVDLDPIEPLEPLGSFAVRLPGDRRRGALDLRLGGEGGEPAADVLLFTGAESGTPVLVPVALDPSGRGRVEIPWADVLEAWLVLRNGAAGVSARFEVHGAHDPFAPFDLASFTADGVGTAMTLAWTTASEKGLVGWNVYRSEGPAGPFIRLNAVALPAFGDGAADTGYLYLDDTARPGRRYYYVVEGITGLGLADRSHVVSGRVPVLRN